MKILAPALVLAVAFGGVASAQPYNDYGPPAGGPGVTVGYNVFYNALSPHGQWVDLSPWGEVWTPWNVPAGWRPYTEGHWAYTNDGWTWVSDFDWGWAPFHYGRWELDASLGWCWIPGNVWGPAWVAWRWGGGLVGWAPLPPGVGWELGYGFTVSDFDVLIPHRAWIFCGDRQFDHTRLHDFIFPYRDNDRLIGRTLDVTDFASIDNRIVDRSIRPTWIARATGRAVPHYRLAQRSRPGRTFESRQTHEVQLFRPRFTARSMNRFAERRGFEHGRRGRAFGPMQAFNKFVGGLLQPQERGHRRFQPRQAQHQQLDRRQFQQRQLQHRQLEHRPLRRQPFQRRQFQNQQVQRQQFQHQPFQRPQFQRRQYRNQQFQRQQFQRGQFQRQEGQAGQRFASARGATQRGRARSGRDPSHRRPHRR